MWAGGVSPSAAPALEPQPGDSSRGAYPQTAAPRKEARTPLQMISRSAPRRLVGTNIDLKLLAILNELHRTRSVSHAAENLQVSQSTISMSLAKLRRHFNDPLFVRTSTGMEPTPHALEVLTLLSKAEGLIQSALEHHVIFDPSTSDRVFHLCSTDIAQLTLLPTLMKRVKETAPHIEVDLRNVSDSIPRLLESGEVDLAVGFIPPMGAGFYQQRLFRDRFVCAVRAGHPRIKHELTLEPFERETHLTVATSGTGHSVVESTLEAKKIRRKVGLRVPNFLGICMDDRGRLLPHRRPGFSIEPAAGAGIRPADRRAPQSGAWHAQRVLHHCSPDYGVQRVPNVSAQEIRQRPGAGFPLHTEPGMVGPGRRSQFELR